MSQVLADAMGSLVNTWRALALPALAVSVPVGLLTVALFRATGGGEFLDVLVNRPETFRTLPEEVFDELARPFYVATLAAMVVQVAAFIFVAMASHVTVAAEVAGEHLTGAQASRRAGRRYPVGLAAGLIGVIVVAGLLIAGLTLWLAPARAVGTPNAASELVAALLLVVSVGPGVWVGVALSMTTPAAAVESTGILGAMRRSRQLVRGRWWATAGFLCLVGLLGGIAIQLIQLIALPLASAGGGTTLLVIVSALGILAQGLLVAAIAAMCTHWYLDLRSRRDGPATADLG